MVKYAPIINPLEGWNRRVNKTTGQWYYYNPTTGKKVTPTSGKIPAPTTQFTNANLAPSTDSFLAGDTTYQDQEAQLRRAYAEFVANQNLNLNNYNVNYGLQKRVLGKNRDRALTDSTDDFAGRGLLHSGLYAKSYSDTQGQFDDQQAQMDAAKAQYESGLNAALSSFQNDQQTTLTSAKQQAIARRAAKYNLGV